MKTQNIYLLFLLFLLFNFQCSSRDNVEDNNINNNPQQQGCMVPTNLSFKNLYNIFSWSDPNVDGAGYFQVQYGAEGFVLGSGTSIETNQKNFDAPLYSGKKYDFYVRKNCGAKGYSNWSKPITILSNNTTACVKPSYVNYTKSSYTPSTFTAQITWENDGISVYEVGFGSLTTPPSSGNTQLILAPSGAAYQLNKNIDYQFYVRKKCANNTFTEYFGPYIIRYN